MKVKRKIVAPGTDEGPWTLDELLAGKGKSILYVETEEAVYVANSLDAAMHLWAEHSAISTKAVEFRDHSQVVNVGRIG